MAVVRPFRALRPPAGLAARVASLPYDVMDVAEARAMAAGEELSFLHVSRPEIDLAADVDPYDAPVYARGRENLDAFVARGVLVPDASPTFSVYRQRMGDHVQTGIVAVASVDDYESGVIARHELTRPDKELDRVRHIDALEAQDEPVFLLSPRSAAVEAVIGAVTTREPEIDMVTTDGIAHTLWVVRDAAEITALESAFDAMARLYVADGHHRSAAAARVRELRRRRAGESGGSAVRERPDGPMPDGVMPDGVLAARPEWDPHDGFLVVVFAAGELAILPYHRVVADLAGRSVDDVIAHLVGVFLVRMSDGPPHPSARHVIGMYLPGQWYRLELREGLVDEGDPVGRLDVSVLQDHVLAPLLHVQNPRTDPRLRFVGGIRGTAELERVVDAGDAAVAFALHPTSVDDLVALADEGRIMPPKSTWFEPKLRSGLFVHPLTP